MRRTPMEMAAYRQAKRAKSKRLGLPQFLQDLMLQPHCRRALWLGFPKRKRVRTPDKVRIVAQYNPHKQTP